MQKVIELTAAELQSGLTRVKWAEALIRQLPEDHDGRNSWLLNYSAVYETTEAAWNGEGLPPAGTVCEYKHVHEWQKVEVFAVKPNYNGSHTALFTYENGCWGACAEPTLFRPIRTAEQIAAEEREQHRAAIMAELNRLWDADTKRSDFLESVYALIVEAGAK